MQCAPDAAFLISKPSKATYWRLDIRIEPVPPQSRTALFAAPSATKWMGAAAVPAIGPRSGQE